MKFTHTLSASAVTALLLAGAAMAPAHAGPRDSDGDGIPNRWEKTHGMNPLHAADAKASR